MESVREGVVITGASSGIGRATALTLDSLGFQVFAGVRRERDAASLRQVASKRLRPIPLDVTDPTSIESAAKTVEIELGDATLRGVVNNAGLSLPHPIELCPLDELRLQLEVNAVGLVAVTQGFLGLLRRDRGRIVNVGSLSGRLTLPHWGAYSASKYAVEAISDAMRRELRPDSIRVSLIEPGATNTPIWTKAETYAEELGAAPAVAENLQQQRANGQALDFIGFAQRTAMSPQVVAAKVRHALTARRPRSRYVVGLNARLLTLSTRLLPDRLGDALVTLMLKTSSAVADRRTRTVRTHQP